jgi:predicted RNase H-like HicB family nuclease
VKFKAVIHEAEEGGFWAEVPMLPGCCAQGRTREELLTNLQEAAEGCIACTVADLEPGAPFEAAAAVDDRTVEIIE